MNRLPLREIDTLFLDAGGTLITMDFAADRARARRRSARRASPEVIARAEAAARPVVSRAIARGGSTEGRDTFTGYVELVLRRALPELAAPARDGARDRTRPAGPRARAARSSSGRWCCPGVPEALARLRAAGLRLVVVSNADGTVEEGLTRGGLRPLARRGDRLARGRLREARPAHLRDTRSASYGSDPARTLHVGDFYAADVRGRARGGRARGAARSAR